MRCAFVEPLPGVVSLDAAPDVHAAGEGFECGTCGGFVSWPEHNDVTAFESVAAVQFRVPFRGPFGDEVGAQLSDAECAADNLLHFAFMEIDARTKHRFRLISGF